MGIYKQIIAGLQKARTALPFKALGSEYVQEGNPPLEHYILSDAYASGSINVIYHSNGKLHSIRIFHHSAKHWMEWTVLFPLEGEAKQVVLVDCDPSSECWRDSDVAEILGHEAAIIARKARVLRAMRHVLDEL